MHDYENRLSNQLGGDSSERSLFWLMPILDIARFVIITSILGFILINGSYHLKMAYLSAKYHSIEFVKGFMEERQNDNK